MARSKNAKATNKVASSRRKAPAAPSERRRPTQARSQRRFESIVQAAAESFAQFGFGDTTMEGIAARAGTSIGSVYQFFPNKRALFVEVADRCLKLTRQSYVEMLGTDPLSQPWAALLDRFIDGFVRINHEVVEMQAIWRNLDLYGEFAEADQAMTQELIEATAGLFAGWVPTLEAAKRRIVATTLVNAVVTLMLAVVRAEDSGEGEALVAETKLMLRRYLSVYLGDPPDTTA
ncbi:MAG: TetR/AcrR family transcriptional regulator [Myxococcota bacterium]